MSNEFLSREKFAKILSSKFLVLDIDSKGNFSCKPEFKDLVNRFIFKVSKRDGELKISYDIKLLGELIKYHENRNYELDDELGDLYSSIESGLVDEYAKENKREDEIEKLLELSKKFTKGLFRDYKLLKNDKIDIIQDIIDLRYL